MKNRIRISVLLLISLMISIFTYASHVDEHQAKIVAANFCHIDSSRMVLKYTSTNSTTNMFYVFEHKDGFVLIAADDRVEPILGYSNEGRPFIVPKENDTIFGNNFLGLMNTYHKVINYVIENNLPGTSDITYKWFTYKTGGYVSKSPTVVVTPLLTTTWGQGWPYNSLCPTDPSGPGGHVWVGCVGTAMAQILKFWNSPTVGLGSFSYQSGAYPVTTANFNTPYNWANMPNSTATVNADISKIMYHAAVSNMSEWGAGSTSVTYYSGEDPMTRGFKNYFKMASSTMQYMEKAGYSNTEWDTYLQTELLAGRPIYYRGDGSFGHAWVCDGVDNANLYHFNFGWDGNYNGYYSLGNINPGGNVLTNNQQAIMGIKPNDGSTLTTNTTWSGIMNFTTNMWVPPSITLTISAGAQIKFSPGCGLYVFGTLICNGNATNYVKLTASDTTNGWNGVRFDNNYNARLAMANNDTSRMIYTQVEYSHSSGVYCMAYGKLILDHSKFNNNHGIYGAGVSVWYIPIRISYCEFYNNHASIYGGAITLTTTETLSSSIDHNNFHDNVADGAGGGFYFMNVNNVAFTWNTSYHNYAPKGAGGAIMYGTMLLTNNKICNNITPIPGLGALYLEHYSGNIVDILIANNTAYGIYCENSSPLIANTTIVNNNYEYACGMVFDVNSNATIKNCIIYGNSANNPSWGTQISLWDGNCDPHFDHSNIQDGLASIGGPGSGSNYNTANYTNNIDLPNQFITPSVGVGAGYDGLGANWNLNPTSPNINIGTLGGIPPNTLPIIDLDENPRITNDSIDIGSYEYLCAGLPVSVSISTSANPVCSGTTVLFTATPVNGGSTPSYQWKKNGTNVGTNLPTYSYIPANNDVITCVLTSNATCVSGNPATSNAITMTITTPLPVSVSIVADQNPVCSGTTVTFTATPVNGGSTPSYQWKKNGTNVGTNLPTYSYIPANNDVITCVLTSNLSCVSGNPATSNAITLSVNTPPIANAGNDQTIGYGASAVLNGSATGGSGNYTYHWEPASMLVNPNIQNPTTINLTSSILFTLTVTDVSSGCVGSDQILVTVTGGILSVDVTATPNPSCAGDLVQLMSIPSGGTGNYTYVWSSNPSGFASTLPNPTVYPTISTTYIVVVNDGFMTASDSLLIVVNPLAGIPSMPIGPDTIDLNTIIFTEYTTTATIAASSYIWELTPASAGTISGIDTIGTVTWNPTYLGTATIKVKAVNTCGESSWSTEKHTFVDNTTGIPSYGSLHIDLYPNPNNGIFSIRSSEKISRVMIFEQLGKPIAEIEQPDMLFVYDYSHLPVGVYIVHIVSTTKIVVKKIIITQ